MVHLEDLPSCLTPLCPGWHRIVFRLQLQSPNNSHCTDDTLGYQLLCLRPRLAQQNTQCRRSQFFVHNFSLPLFAPYLFAPILICTHTYLHSYLFALILICTHTYLHPYLFAPILICTHAYLHPYLFAPILICTHTYLHSYLFAPILICTHTYLHLYLFALMLICTHTYLHPYLFGCPRRNVPNFGRVFLMLKYTDITQNTCIQS
jgi:hypothetical protein